MEPADSCPRLARLAAAELASTHLTLQSPQTAAAASAATHLTLPSPQAAAVEPAATHLTLPPPQAAVGARLERAGVQVEPAGQPAAAVWSTLAE